jgi:hypothetical protein
MDGKKARVAGASTNEGDAAQDLARSGHDELPII